MQKIKHIIHLATKLTTILYLTFLFLEFLKAGVITNYIDLNMVLVVVVGLWLVELYVGRKSEKR